MTGRHQPTGDPRAPRRARGAARDGVDGVETLAGRVGVSPSTVRRDWPDCSGRVGSRGPTAGHWSARHLHRAVVRRAQIHQQAQAAIAETALPLVPEGGTVFLDAGTTLLALARRLVGRGPLTVVTQGLEAALLLVHPDDIRVVVLGGEVRPLNHGVVGALVAVARTAGLRRRLPRRRRRRSRARHRGADAGGDPRQGGRGLRAGSVVVLADSSKLAPATLPAWLPLGPTWTLVTDASVAAARMDPGEVRVLTAPDDSAAARGPI